jgi:hypothetical protein
MQQDNNEPTTDLVVQEVVTPEVMPGHVPPAPVFIQTQNNIQQLIQNVQNLVVNNDNKTVDIVAALTELAHCASNVDVLNYSMEKLSECVAIATAHYRVKPVPDNAYQLAALTSAYNNTFALLDKQKDPVQTIDEISRYIKTAFMKILHSMALAINTTKGELLGKYPDDRPTVEDSFGRMLESIQPSSQDIFNDLEMFLKSTLGIKR